MTNNPTHAVITTFDVDASRRADQELGLRNVIVPGVRVAPGFVSGIWTRSQDGTRSTVVVAFAGADEARDFEVSVRGNASNQAAVGLTLMDSAVVDVSAFVNTQVPD